MKKILISISLLLVVLHSVKAQDVQIQDSPPNWDFMMSDLNTSEITSGILYNKVGMFSGLYDYNRERYNTSHADHFMQAINELHYASDQSKFMPGKQLKTIMATSPTNTIDIGIINSSIHQLNFIEKDPTAGGLTFANDKFVPIAGQPAFLSRKIILASPLQEMATGTAVTYHFSNRLIYNNATTAIKNLVVYFDDATPVPIISNGVLILYDKTIDYTTSGNKTIKFEVTFTDDTSATTMGYHYFSHTSSDPSIYARTTATSTSLVSCSDDLTDRGIYKSTIEFQGYDEPTGYYGKFDYTIFYHKLNNATNQKKLLKPIIVIDGFDPGDTRKTTDCDCEQDTSKGGCFEKNSTGGVFNSTSHESIEDNMLYDINPSEKENLIIKLRSEGYDVIILNIPKYKTSAVGSSIEDKEIDGGGDYVERNGRTLASYIQSINETLKANGSNEKLVIMGPSMGGLISRYGLAYMEKKYAETNNDLWKHNTRIWVSFDSPHLGANIPMAAQANIWFLGFRLRKVKAEEKFNNLINSTAAKQMLISQFSNTLATMSNGTGYSNNSPYFTQFQDNLNNNGVAGSGGFPVSIPDTFRKIAIVNGSLTGNNSGVAGGEFLNIRGYKDPTIIEGILGGYAFGLGGALLGGLFGASKANITVLRIRDKFYPAYGQTDDIFNGDGQNFTIGWSQWYINHKWYNLKGINNDIRGSLDIVPGGTFGTGKVIKDEIVSGLDEVGFSNEIRGTYQESHSFIPAFSSLAHKQPNQSWSNPLNRNLVCSNETPFDSYFGARSNSGHITLTKDMVTWLLKELGDSTTPPSPQLPSYPVDESFLEGDKVICFNANIGYSLDTCKVPSSVTWVVSPNLKVISSTGYNIVVNGFSEGLGSIKAVFLNGQAVSKTVWVGTPKVCIYQAPASTCSRILEVKDVMNGGSVKNQGINEGQVVWKQRGRSESGFSYYFTDTRTYYPIVLSATNTCGATTLSPYTPIMVSPKCGAPYLKFYNSKSPIDVETTDQNSNEDLTHNVYPNPAKDIINIQSNNSYKDMASFFSIQLYDMKGSMVKSFELLKNQATISVFDLSKGIYNLKIISNDLIENHRIIIE